MTAIVTALGAKAGARANATLVVATAVRSPQRSGCLTVRSSSASQSVVEDRRAPAFGNQMVGLDRVVRPKQMVAICLEVAPRVASEWTDLSPTTGAVADRPAALGQAVLLTILPCPGGGAAWTGVLDAPASSPSRSFFTSGALALTGSGGFTGGDAATLETLMISVPAVRGEQPQRLRGGA